MRADPHGSNLASNEHNQYHQDKSITEEEGID